MTTATPTVPLPRTVTVRPGLRRLGIRIVTGIVLLALWEGLATWFAASYVARPSGIVRVLPDVLANRPTTMTPLTGSFWHSCRLTVVAVFEGLAIGVVLGVVVGLTMGRLRDAESLLKFYVNAFFAMPILAMLPVMTLWWGYSSTTRLAIITLGAFLPVCLNVYDGVRRLPTEFVEVARTYRARWWNVWFGIALPASLPYLLAGIKLAAGRALVAGVVAEFLLAIHGLGFFIIANSRSFNQNQAMVAVVILAAVGVAINSSADFAIRRLLPWYRRS
jgi:NitT/TauT family transport system permease protein